MRSQETARQQILDRAADERIAVEHVQEICTAGGRRELPGDVDEQLPARLMHGTGRQHLPDRQAERLYRIDHHLLVTDGQIDVPLAVLPGRDREERGDRSALDDGEYAIEQAPLDVLRRTEMLLDPPSEGSEHTRLPVAEDCVSAPCPGEDLSAAKLDALRNHSAGNERFTRARASLDRNNSPVAGHGVGGKNHPRSLGRHHALHDHPHRDVAVRDPVALAIDHCPFGIERGPA